MDYFKDVGRVKYTSAPELREGLGDSGFIAYKGQIQPSFDEFWNGLTVNVEEIERRINKAVVFAPSLPTIVVCVLLSNFAVILILGLGLKESLKTNFSSLALKAKSLALETKSLV